MRTHPAIQKVEAKYIRKGIPDFRSGDTLVIKIRVREGTRERLQAFEGVVIAMRHRGLNSAFTVRRIAHGIGVERSFQTHSPMIESIQIKRHGDVRKAKLYHLRELTGRKARIREKIQSADTEAANPETPQEQAPDGTEATAKAAVNEQVEAGADHQTEDPIEQPVEDVQPAAAANEGNQDTPAEVEGEVENEALDVPASKDKAKGDD